MSNISRFEVCPHCHERFTPTEYMPPVVDLLEQMTRDLEITAGAVQEGDLETAWGNLKGTEGDLKKLFKRLCDLWDGTDSEGYAAFCEQDD